MATKPKQARYIYLMLHVNKDLPVQWEWLERKNIGKRLQWARERNACSKLLRFEKGDLKNFIMADLLRDEFFDEDVKRRLEKFLKNSDPSI